MQAPSLPADVRAMYDRIEDKGEIIPAVPEDVLSERNRRQEVDYWTDEEPGTIVVDPHARFLYLVLEGDRAMRYGVAVGDDGRGFAGTGNIPFTREWPRWTPTQNMLERDPEKYGPYRDGMEGGIENPLGARALYLFKDGRDTLYRIHGTNDPFSIGKATSAGCIRLFNQDILDLHERVRAGAKVVVLSETESGKGTNPPSADRSISISSTTLTDTGATR
ncbi:L,D-transpeptidase catalytic domain [Tranquillimonas alkanivorans]|uniref:L,D-transpeptidase catalytic domain n=2 Tax=Tranquillimonas alkanivorans TaxID=441119 RepID=A0A1I5UDM1_9RHOB|nr:L,D-transpeptidase catalytic domain [Tranquillimonas alkanivorans]